MSSFTRREALLGVGAGLWTMAGARALGATARRRCWVGTFTNASGETVPTDFGERGADHISRGLYTFEFDPATGRAGELQLAAEISNPGNLITHRSGRVVYACRGQNSRIQGQSPITAFAVQGAMLRELNTVPSGGSGPTVGVVDKTGRNLLTTNFGSNSIVCFRLEVDGSLGERTAYLGKAFATGGGAPRAGGPGPATAPAAGTPGIPVAAEEVAAGRTKPHAIVLSQSERYAIAAEINANRCVVMRFDAARGTLEEHGAASAHEGAGPRHLNFEPSGRFLYTSDEDDSTITAWRWNESRGELTAIQHLPTLPPGFGSGNHPADVQVHPGGRFVYVSNRITGTLAGFAIDARDGTLTRLADTPMGSAASWSFIFDPSGRWMLLTAQTGDFVAIYAVDQKTGALTPTGQRLTVTLPICIRMT
jgi:6-phosphogluconolactonase